MIKHLFGHLVASVGAGQLAAIAALGAMWLLEQYLGASKRVRANSIVQALFNVLYSRARLRFALVAKLGNIAAELEAETAAAKGSSSISPPPAPPAAGLLVLVISASLLAASGCGAGGAALKACELGKLGSDGQIALTAGQAIASNPGSTVADLEAAALQFAPGQLDCALQALVAWWANKPADTTTPGMDDVHTLVAASHDAQRMHAIDVIGRYLAAHKPTACGPAPRVL